MHKISVVSSRQGLVGSLVAASKAKADVCPNKPLSECREEISETRTATLHQRQGFAAAPSKSAPASRNSASVLHHPNAPFLPMAKLWDEFDKMLRQNTAK